MPTKPYLITGATGQTGIPAIHTLLAAGAPVRAMVHREDARSAALQQAGAEIVIGDLNSFTDVKKALEGVRGAYFCYPISPGIVQASAQFAHAARRAGVEGVVNMSQVIAREGAPSHASEHHWLAERVFDWSGIPVTHLRPSFFMEWTHALAPMIRGGAVYVPYGGGKAGFVSGDDQGRLIAAILLSPQAHRGKTYELFGPENLSFADVVARIGEMVGRTVAYQQVPFEAMWAGFKQASSSLPTNNSALTGYAETNPPTASGPTFIEQHLKAAVGDYEAGRFAGSNALFEEITGQPAMNLRSFLESRKEIFL